MSKMGDLSDYAQHDLVEDLTAIRASKSRLADIAARSYAHDNGFLKIVLDEDRESGRSLRLHIWSEEAQPETNIHNHRWDFESLVLAGALEFEKYVVDDDGPIEAEHYRYLPAEGLEYAMRSGGRARLRPSCEGRHAASGVPYTMSAEVLHRTWGQAGVRTITLLAQGQRRRDHADVYVTREDSDEGEVSNVPMTPRELDAELARVIAQISSAP